MFWLCDFPFLLLHLLKSLNLAEIIKNERRVVLKSAKGEFVPQENEAGN